ncbi:hypothetical protein D1B31_01660 [Neobacillus notoginsengisoli]|uniref:Uncharacterized protein n=1 Tax=Neobacillus notoginsengisoli TaxID=1578198 RepID=A0A417Z060_9BACI|nr:hypothetical protein [Neobacillus notoginsengisoli]RHW43394.1 hypothetical protein D1B31_01660 [Neobacillus notoginsengisoli]
MELVLLSIFMILAGIFPIWMSIFGKKEDVKQFGPSIPTDCGEFFMMIIYKIFPSIIRRIFLFLLGIGLIVGAIFIMLNK